MAKVLSAPPEPSTPPSSPVTASTPEAPRDRTAFERLPRIGGITPDEVLLLRKRQEWRARVLSISIETLEHLDVGESDRGADTPGDLVPALRRFRSISDHIRRDIQRLLETEMLVPLLDSQRHAANYFLDTIIGYVRGRAQDRNLEEGKTILSPLESLSYEEVETFVHEAIERSTDSIIVFLKSLTSLENFEIEVRTQRKRLQYLLGCDRNLRDLAESNSEIIEAPLDQFESIVERFFHTCHCLRNDLGPLLELSSPYPKLDEELTNARAQLQQLEDDVIRPLVELRDQVDTFDTVFKPLARDLEAVQEKAAEIIRFNVGPDSREQTRDVIKIVPMVRLRTLITNFQTILQLVAYDRLDELTSFQAKSAADHDPHQEVDTLCDALIRLSEEAAGQSSRVLERILCVLQQAEIVNEQVDLEALESGFAELRRWLETVAEDFLQPALSLVSELRERNARRLKERICQEMGFIRTTFLQPCFAHIAADDPRSLHTPQYFYFKEFAEEAKHSQQLLERIYNLWQYIERLQTTKIQGLKFTPNNLNKIAQRVLLERRTVPSGRGWKELERFLLCLKDDLVARLEASCALPGVRFDDKNELSAYGDRITEDCAMLLAKRETAYRLIKEVDRVGLEEGHEALHERYRTTILRVTCQDMAEKLRSISQTLLEMIPYVGAMVGGIRMRTSLTFVEIPAAASSSRIDD